MSQPVQFESLQPQIPRRRPRGRGLGVVIALIVLLVIASLIADGIVRSQAAKQIEQQVRAAASLSPSTPVDVTIGGLSVLLQLASGKLNDVEISVNNLEVGSLRGNAKIAATGVPITSTQAIGTARLDFAMDQKQLAPLLEGYAKAAGVNISSVTISKGAVQAGTKFSILGVTLPVAVSLVPSTFGGQLALTPQTVTVGGRTLTADQVRSQFGSIADAVLKTQQICVASYLPKVLTLDSIVVTGSTVHLTVSGKNLTLNDSLLTSKGVCP